MSSFDLDHPLVEFISDSSRGVFTYRHSFEGIQIFGGIGGGKSSGPGKLFAHKFMQHGYGGLVLTAKEDEASVWKEYAEMTGRSKDLIILEPNGKHTFNFLQYEAESGPDGMAPTENLVDLLKTVIKASEEKDTGSINDPFWEHSLNMLIFNIIDLCKLAYGRLSIQLMYDIAQTLPQKHEPVSEEGKQTAFEKAFRAAQRNVTAQMDAWIASLSENKQRRFQEDGDLFEEELVENLPDARLLRFLDQFFMQSFRNLSDKTRSIIEFSFSNFLLRLLREPVYSLFCRYDCTFRPEDSLQGKIILLNLSVKRYQKVGRDCQILFKYIWQRAMEKRDLRQNTRPVFLYADESQNFIHELDALFQATARSSRVATLYITQNLPNYYAAIGEKSEHRVKGFLGTMACKIFTANADNETNEYASKLIGDGYFIDQSRSVTLSQTISQTQGQSLKLERVVRPEQFQSLKTGGPKNNYRVEAYLHRQGDALFNGVNYLKTNFNQLYRPKENHVSL
ncbi:type IV secretory system conjugative DNA transfer family protein [Larkinella sp. VNQ87]|uniref:type IV secretory system conjugative DNA transfer family protein n=1 Tax=Larkinella sp. VNQ87 TaxID=3400921 RepID=UPI003C03E22B